MRLRLSVHERAEEQQMRSDGSTEALLVGKSDAIFAYDPEEGNMLLGWLESHIIKNCYDL